MPSLVADYIVKIFSFSIAKEPNATSIGTKNLVIQVPL